MKILLEVPDNKAHSLMDVLQSISYVKAKPIKTRKSRLLKELEEAAEELNEIKAGRKQANTAEDFLNGLHR